MSKGVSLYISIVILSIVLAVILGLTTILVGQIKMVRLSGYSVIAIYAADTGIERVLKDIYNPGAGLNNPNSEYEETITSEVSYKVKVTCCDKSTNELCIFSSTDDGDSSNDCPTNLTVDASCKGTMYCIRSTGNYNQTKRAIEVKL